MSLQHTTGEELQKNASTLTTMTESRKIFENHP